MPEKTVAPQQPGDPDGLETTRERERFVTPPVDIFETADGLVVLADLPGVTMDGLKIEVRDSVLTIVGRTREALPGHSIQREFSLASFFREFELSNKVDAARIGAEFRHGVLTLRLPKAEEAKPKTIAVQVG